MADSHDTDALIRALVERLAVIERDQAVTSERLREGAQTFGELRDSIRETQAEFREALQVLEVQVQPKPFPAWKAVGIAIPILSMLIGAIWMLASYPNRAEFDATKKDAAQERTEIRRDVGDLQRSTVELRGDVKQIRESQARTERTIEKIDDSLDRVLQGRER